MSPFRGAPLVAISLYIPRHKGGAPVRKYIRADSPSGKMGQMFWPYGDDALLKGLPVGRFNDPVSTDYVAGRNSSLGALPRAPRRPFSNRESIKWISV